jgi:transglutaminase superfamily protein
MKRAIKFFGLPAGDQCLLMNALIVVAGVRLRLALLPFRAGKSYCSPRKRMAQSSPSPERIAWAVNHAGGLLGNATCLARAVSGQIMLARRGFSSRVSIGVTPAAPRSTEGSLVAHAWLEFGGQILLGGPDVGRYTRLFTWGS